MAHQKPYTKIHNKGKVLCALQTGLIYYRFDVKRVIRSARKFQ
jgi:hypothetical protein